MYTNEVGHDIGCIVVCDGLGLSFVCEFVDMCNTFEIDTISSVEKSTCNTFTDDVISSCLRWIEVVIAK